MAVATPHWPTLTETNDVCDKLDEANDALERLVLDTHHVIDHTDPLEPRDGAPSPTMEDIAVLTILLERAADEIDTMQRHLRDLTKLREPAVYLLGRSTNA